MRFTVVLRRIEDGGVEGELVRKGTGTAQPSLVGWNCLLSSREDLPPTNHTK
jgi:hypothetical protein